MRFPVGAFLFLSVPARAALSGLPSSSWQARLDRALLSVDATPEQRFRNLQRVVNDPQVAVDVRAAVTALSSDGFAEGHVTVLDTLWPRGTTARSDLEALMALRKQVPELIQRLERPRLKEWNQFPVTQLDPTTVAAEVLALARDQSKQRELFEEAKNALRSTPKGLETPAYTCVRTLGDSKIEIRKYAPFTVARREMRDGISSLEGGGAGFNDLATYLFGGNELQQAMSMTTPVLIDVVADSSSMAFVLPSTCAESPPAPSAAEVSIAQVPERLVAALPFPGIVTEEEVARRRAEMAAALLANGSEYRQACDGEYSVLQYNAPYTVPWRRRNELVVVLAKECDDGVDEAPPKVTSWYDSGVRI